MGIVLDTNVVLSGVLSSSGASAEVLRRVRHGRIHMLCTPALFLEYEDVLKRPEHLLKLQLTVAQVDQFLEALASVIAPVEISYRWRPQLADADDEMVLEAAVNGRANSILTFNARHLQPATGTFGIGVLTPKSFLESLS